MVYAFPFTEWKLISHAGLSNVGCGCPANNLRRSRLGQEIGFSTLQMNLNIG